MYVYMMDIFAVEFILQNRRMKPDTIWTESTCLPDADDDADDDGKKNIHIHICTYVFVIMCECVNTQVFHCGFRGGMCMRV